MRILLTVHMPCIESFFLSFFISRNEKCVRILFALKERKAKGSARISKCQTERRNLPVNAVQTPPHVVSSFPFLSVTRCQ